jgi:hypothetical protein
MTRSQHVYEVRPRNDKRGVYLISDALPFGRLWYGEPNAVRKAIGYAEFRSRSHRAVIRVCVFAAPKRIGLKSYRRLFGIAGKIILDYVIRRFDAPSALLKSGLDLR